MDSAPGIPTLVEGLGFEQIQNQLAPDDYTAVLNQSLNSVIELPRSAPSFGRAVIWQNGDVGLPDQTYNVGYKMQPVDNQVNALGYNHEAPEVPVTNLPWIQSIYNSTLVQEQVGSRQWTSLRAPEINEGFQAV